MLFLLCLTFPLFSQQSKKITWGIYGGWSWGTGYAFQWHYSPYSDRNVLQFHLGGYVRLNLSPSFGLQLDANYQNFLSKWTLRHPSLPYDSGEDSFGFLSLCLKGIYSLPKWDLFQLYIAGGGGINTAEWWGFRGIYFNLVGGPGIKLFLWKSNSAVALNLGSSFIYLFDPNGWGYNSAFYIRLNIGLEF